MSDWENVWWTWWWNGSLDCRVLPDLLRSRNEFYFYHRFVIIINYIRFPCEGDDSSVASVKCHNLRSPNYINVRWKTCKAYGARNWNVISKWQTSVVLNRITEVSDKYIKQQWPKERSLSNTRQHFQGYWLNAMDSKWRIRQ